MPFMMLIRPLDIIKYLGVLFVLNLFFSGK